MVVLLQDTYSMPSIISNELDLLKRVSGLIAYTRISVQGN